MIVVRHNIDTLDRTVAAVARGRRRRLRRSPCATCRCASRSTSRPRAAHRRALLQVTAVPARHRTTRARGAHMLDHPASRPSKPRRGRRQPPAVRHRPARARLRPHARQLAAPHAALVDPRRGGHRRCASTTRSTSSTPSRASRKTSPTSSSTSRTSCCTCDVRRAGHAAPRRARPGRGHRRRHPDHRRRRDPQPGPPHRHAQRQGPPRHRPHRRAGPRLRRRPSATSARRTIGVIPVDAIFSPVRRVAVRGRADPRRAVHRTTTASSSTSRPTVRSRRARRWPRPAPRCASLVDLVAEMSDEPAGPRARRGRRRRRRLARPRPPDRGPRPVRASRATASSGRRSTRSASCVQKTEDDLLDHHQLRPEVASTRSSQKLDERGLSLRG